MNQSNYVPGTNRPVLKRYGVKFLGAEVEKALRELGVESLRELLEYRPLVAATTLITAAKGALNIDDIRPLLNEDYRAADVSEAAAWPLIALRGLAGQEQDILRRIGVRTVAELAAFGSFAQREIQHALESNGFYERPSAPAELLPGLVGAVTSSVRFNTFVQDDELRRLNYVINKQCVPRLPISGEFPGKGGQPALAGALSDLAKRAVDPSILANLKTQLSQATNAAGLVDALRKSLVTTEQSSGGSITELFEKSRCQVFRLGYLCGHRQQWINQGTHLGEVLHSIALAPGEPRNIAYVNWNRSQITRRNENTNVAEQLDANFVQTRALEEVTSAVAREHQTGGSATEANTASTAVGAVGALALGAGIGAAVGTAVAPGVGTAIGASVGAGIAGVAALGVVSTSASTLGQIESDTRGDRSIVADVQQRIAMSTTQRASAVRSLWTTAVVEDTQAEGVQAQTSNITNYNHMHTLNVMHYEVLQHYLTRTELEQVQPLLFLPFTHLDFTRMRFIRDYWDSVRDYIEDEGLRAQGDLYFVTEGIPEQPDLLPVPPLLEFEKATLTGVVLQLIFVSDSRIDFTVTVRADGVDHVGTRGTATAGDVRNLKFSFPTMTTDSDVSVRVGIDRSTGGTLGITVNVLEATVEFRNSRRLLENIGLGQVTYRNSELKATKSLTWDIPNMDTNTTPSKALNAKRRAQAKAENDSRLQAFAELSDSLARFEERLQRLVLRKRHFFTRVILNAIEPEELLQLLEAVGIGHDDMNPNNPGNPGAAVPLSSIASTIPVGITAGAFVLKLRNLTEAQAQRIIKQAGMNAPDVPDIVALLAYARETLEHFDQQIANGSLTRTDHVYLPTSGLFAEGILGVANSAEYLDMERYFHWVDSPIPHQAPPIAPVSTESRFQRGDVSVNIPEGSLQVINPVSMPDPTGLQSVLSAVQNGGMFRDMSKTSELSGIIGSLASLASTIGQAAANMTGKAAEQALQSATDLGKTAANLASSNIANGGRVKTPTVVGSEINTGRNIDDDEKRRIPTPDVGTPTPPNVPTPPSRREQAWRNNSGTPAPTPTTMAYRMGITFLDSEGGTYPSGNYSARFKLFGTGQEVRLNGGQTIDISEEDMLFRDVFDLEPGRMVSLILDTDIGGFQSRASLDFTLPATPDLPFRVKMGASRPTSVETTDVSSAVQEVLRRLDFSVGGNLLLNALLNANLKFPFKVAEVDLSGGSNRTIDLKSELQLGGSTTTTGTTSNTTTKKYEVVVPTGVWEITRVTG